MLVGTKGLRVLHTVNFDKILKFIRLRKLEKQLESSRRQAKPFAKLDLVTKSKIREYYLAYEDILQRRTFLVNQEAKVQLVLQNALIIYQVRKK